MIRFILLHLVKIKNTNHLSWKWKGFCRHIGTTSAETHFVYLNIVHWYKCWHDLAEIPRASEIWNGIVWRKLKNHFKSTVPLIRRTYKTLSNIQSIVRPFAVHFKSPASPLPSLPTRHNSYLTLINAIQFSHITILHRVSGQRRDSRK